MGHTLASTNCHFSPTRSARIFHISRRTSKYAVASSSSLTPPFHWSAFWRSIRRSCRLRQALAVLEGKCLGAIWFQLRPWARAAFSVSSSFGVHDELRVPPPAAEAAEKESRWAGGALLSALGMVIMRAKKKKTIDAKWKGQRIWEEGLEAGDNDSGVLRLA